LALGAAIMLAIKKWARRMTPDPGADAQIF